NAAAVDPIIKARLVEQGAQCLAARPPTSRSSSRATRQSGQRRSGGATSSLKDHPTNSIKPVRRTAKPPGRWRLMSTRQSSAAICSPREAMKMADDHESPKAVFRRVTSGLQPGQPIQTELVEVAQPTTTSPLCAAVGQTLKAYGAAARDLLAGQYARD